MRLELWGESSVSDICRFHGHAVQIRTRKDEHLWLPLIVTEHHEFRYLKDWREGKTRVGEITISTFKDRADIFVSFKREVEPKLVGGICGVGINERSVDLTVLKPSERPKHTSLDVSKLPAIRHASQLKRKSIQQKLDALPQRPVQKRRLWAKYWRRERNRTNQIMHVVSKRISEIAERERTAFAFEGIEKIRESMRSKRKSRNGKTLHKDMRRRLNQWPFRKLQFFVEYKVARQGLPTVEVSNYHKSKDCPVCGRYNRPNGHAHRCQTCGFEASRHLVTSWNLPCSDREENPAKDGARHVPADCWQMQRVAEGLVAPEKLSVEPEKNPVSDWCSLIRDFRTVVSARF